MRIQKKKFLNLKLKKSESTEKIINPDPEYYLVEIIENLFIGGSLKRLLIGSNAWVIKAALNRSYFQSLSREMSQRSGSSFRLRKL